MGTRSLTCVIINGEYKVSQYGQWDGYPEEQGKTILSFLRSLNEKTKKIFIEKCKSAKFISPEKIKNSVDLYEKYPELSRNIGGKILKIIFEKPKGIKLLNNIKFASDSLFCEWAYVIDIDKNTFEIYRGLNKIGLEPNERFFSFSDPVKKKYFPVRLWLTYNLNKLPTIKEFLKTINKKIKMEKN